MPVSLGKLSWTVLPGPIVLLLPLTLTPSPLSVITLPLTVVRSAFEMMIPASPLKRIVLSLTSTFCGRLPGRLLDVDALVGVALTVALAIDADEVPHDREAVRVREREAALAVADDVVGDDHAVGVVDADRPRARAVERRRAVLADTDVVEADLRVVRHAGDALDVDAVLEPTTTLPSAAVAPPITVCSAPLIVAMPMSFGSETLPVAFVPTRFAAMTLSCAPVEPSIRIP